MNRTATLALMAATLVACDSSTAAPTCADDPSQSACPPLQAVGAAYVTPAGTVNLISLDGTRWVSWDPGSGTFGPAADVADLETDGLPLASIGAAGTTIAGSETFMVDGLGHSYTAYEYGSGTYRDAESFGPSDVLGTPTLTNVGAISRAANTPRFFIFDSAGTSWQLWRYGDLAWTDVQSFADDFGGGGAPIANVGAAVYVNGTYYLFNVSGTQWATYLGDFVFEGPFDIADLGDGSLDFR